MRVLSLLEKPREAARARAGRPKAFHFCCRADTKKNICPGRVEKRASGKGDKDLKAVHSHRAVSMAVKSLLSCWRQCPSGLALKKAPGPACLRQASGAEQERGVLHLKNGYKHKAVVAKQVHKQNNWSGARDDRAAGEPAWACHNADAQKPENGVGVAHLPD